MAGWSKAKRIAAEEGFYKFLDRCFVNSRDEGHICLGKHLYDGQRRAISQIFDALEADIHKVYILKSRQLGISTLVRALTVFLLGIHRGLSGALVFDTAANRDNARSELVTMIRDLPASLKFPKVRGTGEGNREGLTLVNDSRILFKSAGVKKSKSSGTLGRSVGLSLATLSELCSFDNDEGLEAFENSLSDINPDRLYVYESTARGPNRWKLMWDEARKDTLHCKCIFLGWWSKESQMIPQDDRDFQVYGTYPPSDKEIAKINRVKELYGHTITVEQLAWIRRRMDPTAQPEGDANPEFEGDPFRIQEQPWCVVAGTKVGTNLGVVPIEDAIGAASCGQGRIVAGGPTGRAVIWRVKTKLGYEFSGTSNHPLIQTDGSQVMLSESMGKRIKLAIPKAADDVCRYAWREPPAEVTVKINEDLARFVGLFMGDGSASDSRRYSVSEVSICCTAKDGDVVAECERLFDSVFGVAATKNPKDGWVSVRTGQKRVLTMLRNLGLLRNDTGPTMRRVHVPEFIWRSPLYVVRHFVQGLFEADGYNGFGSHRVALFSKYPEFIRDVQLLLLMFGITSRNVSMRKKAGDGHFYTGNQLELRTEESIAFNERIGFISKRKRDRHVVRSIVTRAKPMLLEDEIVSVENTGEIETVWNLTVDESHLFDANGILTHNTEQEAWQITGSIFFPPEKLTDQYNEHVSLDFKTYMYVTTDEFAFTQVLKAPNAKMVELKVWEPPANDAVYVMGVDPAFGTSETNARSAIQVCRCYADGLDQVAEYAWPLITAEHLAWVIASILGWYGSTGSEIRYALELNGPGMAVFTGLKSLKFQLENGYQPKEVKEKGLENVFRNVRTYVWNRADSMGSGFNYHIKTNRGTKSSMLEQLRNVVSTGKLRIRSSELIEEMRVVERDKDDGDIIGVPRGSKDDRVMSAAFAVNCWEEKVRRNLINMNRTREAEAARQRLSITDQVFLFQQNQLGQFFKAKTMQRLTVQRQAQYARWRHR